MKRVVITGEPIQVGAEYTSKGNQKKWCQDGYWYKANQFGYEDLAESLCAELLRRAIPDMKQKPLADITVYESIEIEADGERYRGCRSVDFSREEWQLMPIERLYRAYNGESAAAALARIADVKTRIAYLVDFVSRVTGLENFGAYMTLMLEMDAFFLNEDRHLNNIAVLWNADTDEYDYCPYFDMGLSLFSDTREEFPLELDYEVCREKIQSKPFARDYDAQLDAAQELYGYYLQFPWGVTEMRKIAEDFFYLHPEVERKIAKRVTETLVQQARKYGYMFER